MMLTAILAANGSVVADDAWRVSGDLRSSLNWSERSERDGATSSSDALRLRARVAVQRAFGADIEARVRLAGRFSSEQDRSRLWLRRSAPGRTGAAFGDAVPDEAWLRWRPRYRNWSVQLGRFQTVHALATLQGKGLGQNDSPNVDIHWTDGLRVERALAPGATLRVQLQSMPSAGPGSVHLAPLDFSSSGSRVAAYVGVDSGAARGPFIQRAVGIHWYPNALPSVRTAASDREDYLILSARAVAAWSFGDAGRRMLLGGEVGYAPNTPADASGNAWQIELDVENPGRKQSAGIALGRAGAGWLVSSDFRNNDRLGELRWLWRIHPKLSLDARWRWRQEIAPPAGSPRARIDRDAYLRMTLRFP